jgi:hypothetical protein
MTWDRRLSLPSERRCAEEFFAIKTRELVYQRQVSYLKTTEAAWEAVSSLTNK